MTHESGLGPCQRFTVLESRRRESVQCEVCEHVEAAHESAGRRTLSGAQIEELRRRILIERYDRLEDERRRGANPANAEISANGNPELH